MYLLPVEHSSEAIYACDLAGTLYQKIMPALLERLPPPKTPFNLHGLPSQRLSHRGLHCFARKLARTQFFCLVLAIWAGAKEEGWFGIRQLSIEPRLPSAAPTMALSTSYPQFVQLFLRVALCIASHIERRRAVQGAI